MIYCFSRRIECCGVWRSLVAHLLWEQGAGGSNPLTPTTFTLPATAPLCGFCAGTVFSHIRSAVQEETLADGEL